MSALITPPLDHVPGISRIYRADARHFTPGRGGRPIRWLVLHNTETAAGGPCPSAGWLSTLSPPPRENVSIHHLIGRDAIRYDIVNRGDTSYHSGNVQIAEFDSARDENAGWYFNQESIGLEFENSSNGSNRRESYTVAQLQTAAYTIATEMISYGIPWERVVCHKDIAYPAGRRVDPSYFPMPIFRGMVEAWRAFLITVPPEHVSDWFI